MQCLIRFRDTNLVFVCVALPKSRVFLPLSLFFKWFIRNPFGTTGGLNAFYVLRKKLFNLINDVPTVLDVVTGKKPLRESIASVKENKATISHKPNGKANSSSTKLVC